MTDRFLASSGSVSKLAGELRAGVRALSLYGYTRTHHTGVSMLLTIPSFCVRLDGSHNSCEMLTKYWQFAQHERTVSPVSIAELLLRLPSLD